MSTRVKRVGTRDERGAALVEFAIAVPILIALLALIFDAGLGYSAARSSSSAARSSALVGARAGESRDADYRALDALLAEFGKNNRTPAEIEQIVQRVVIYRSEPGGNGEPPDACTSSTNTPAAACNVYSGSDLANLNQADFEGVQTLPGGKVVCASSSKDVAWCPLQRRDDEGSFLGVYVETTSEAAIGIGTDDFKLGDRAVFSMYFLPEPVPLGSPSAP